MWQESHEAFLKQAEMKTVLDMVVLRRSYTDTLRGQLRRPTLGTKDYCGTTVGKHVPVIYSESRPPRSVWERQKYRVWK